MRLGDINNLGAAALNEDMQKRVGWNFGNINKLTAAQASAMLESIDSKIGVFKHSKQLHESEKHNAYNGLILAKQVLESYIAEKAMSKDQQRAAGAALAAKRGDAPKSKLKGASKAMMKMSTKELEKFAGTKHKGLPEKKKTNESKERPYVAVHAKKGKTEVTGSSSYDAAKKAAEKWKLKSTAGVDVYLADVKHVATESINKSASRAVFEDEVGAAETLMAAQDMVDSIQGMLEDVGEMINEKLPPLTDSIRRSGGAEAAAEFNQQTNSALNALMDAVRTAREAMAGAVGTLSGEAPTPMGSEASDDFDLDTAEPAAEPAGDDAEFDLDDFEASDAAQGGNEPLGRAKRA